MTYRVAIEDWAITYIEVEAADEDAAEEKAFQEWEDGFHDFADSSVKVTYVEKINNEAV